MKSILIVLTVFSFNFVFAGGSSLGGVTGTGGGTTSSLEFNADAIIEMEYGNLAIKGLSVFEQNQEIFNFSEQNIGPGDIAAVITNSDNFMSVSPAEIIENYNLNNSYKLAKPYDPKASAGKLMMDFGLGQSDIATSVFEGLK